MLKRAFGTVRGRDPGERSAQVEVVRVSQSLLRHGDEVRKNTLSVVWSGYRTSIRTLRTGQRKSECELEAVGSHRQSS